MSVKKVRDQYMNIQDEPPQKSKSKPKAYVPGFIEQYIIQRETVINDDMAKNYLKEKYDNATEADKLRMLGIKSAPVAKVVTEQQDKANTASRFAEDNIVNAWAKWFKQAYADIPFTIDKVAQSRGKLSGAIMAAASYRRGNPDIFIQSPKAGYAGCFIEQKTSEDIFYQGTRILKPGSDNRMIWQSLYHADLREQGYWVMFSISLEATKKISERYMAGNPYPQQIFTYHCKPEDTLMFEGFKHFRPVERP